MRHRVEVLFVLSEPGTYLGEMLLNPQWPENVGKIRLPGGKVEDAETPHQAAVRELGEEYNIEIHVEDLSLYTVTDGNNGRATRLLYRGYADLFAGIVSDENGQGVVGVLVRVNEVPPPWFSTRNQTEEKVC